VEREQVISTVQKLLRLAESDNENEAQLAADRAAELMQRYKIELAMLGTLDPDSITIEQVTLWDKCSVDWHEHLALGIASINDCGVWKCGRKELLICGTDSSMQVTNYMFHYLLRTIRKLSRMYVREFGGRHSQRMAFAAGCVHRVVERLKERKKAREDVAVADHGCTALMVVNSERKEVQRWMQNNLQLGKARRRRGRGGQSYWDGREAGNSVNIRDGLNGGRKPDPKQLK
jgi:hypothetical protein